MVFNFNFCVFLALYKMIIFALLLIFDEFFVVIDLFFLKVGLSFVRDFSVVFLGYLFFLKIIMFFLFVILIGVIFFWNFFVLMVVFVLSCDWSVKVFCFFWFMWYV